MSPARTSLDRMQAARPGMILAVHAREQGETPALITDAGTLTFDQLNARVNRLARALRTRGLSAGDSITSVCSNRTEFAEIMMAATRIGLRFTPVNWHFTGPEIAYVVNDCGARALIGDARFAENLAAAATLTPGATLKLALGGDIEGFDSYEDAFTEEDLDRWEDLPVPGRRFYSRADAVTALAIATLERLSGPRQFLWVHYFDPHDPYGDGDASPIGLRALLAELAREPRNFGEPLDRAREAYARDVGFLDASLGDFLARLESDAKTIEARTLRVVSRGAELVLLFSPEPLATPETRHTGTLRPRWLRQVRLRGVEVDKNPVPSKPVSYFQGEIEEGKTVGIPVTLRHDG